MASASGFKHDAAGFLLGEIVESNRDLARMQTQGMALWKDIRADMKALRQAIGVQAEATQRMARPGAAPRAPAASRANGGNWRVQTTAVRGAAEQRSAVARGPAAVTQPRAASGRFTATQRPANVADTGGGAGSPTGSRRMADVLGRLASSLPSAHGVDPTLDAAKELKSVISPLGRGLFSLTSRATERKREVWFRRILRALSPTSKKDKAAGGGGLFFGGSGGAGGGGLGGMLGAAGGGAAAGMLGTLMKGGKGLMRRLPFIGGLLAAGSAAWSMFKEDDPTKTPDENRAGRYRGVGSAGGMLAGGFAGARLGAIAGGAIGSIIPGAGTAVGAAVGAFLGGIGGAMLGDRFGAEVGVWVKSLVDYDLPGKALTVWNSFTADLSKTWAGISEKAGAWIDSAKQGISTTLQPIRDAGSAIAKKLDGITDGGLSNDWKATKGMLSGAWDSTKNAGNSAVEALGTLVPSSLKTAVAAGPEIRQRMVADRAAAGGSLGDVIAKGEGDYSSFNRGKAGDARGEKRDFARMTLDEVMAAQALPKGDPNRVFAVGRYQVVPSTMKAAVAAMGLKGDEKFDPAMQDKIFSQYLVGQKRPEIAGFVTGQHDNLAAAQKAGAKEFASIANPETGRSYYSSGNNKASLSADAFGGALTGARARYRDLVAAGVPSADAYKTVVAGVSNLPSTPAVSIPSSVPPTIPKAPEIKDPAIPLNSPAAGAGRGASTASNPDQVPQNVGDRQIAHVVTGGLGATGRW